MNGIVVISKKEEAYLLEISTLIFMDEIISQQGFASK